MLHFFKKQSFNLERNSIVKKLHKCPSNATSWYSLVYLHKDLQERRNHGTS